MPVLAGSHVIGTLDVESDHTGVFDGSAILDYERLAVALLPLGD